MGWRFDVHVDVDVCGTASADADARRRTGLDWGFEGWD